MISLLIDTSTSNLTVSIINDQEVIYIYQETILSDMSSKLLPIIDNGLKELDLKRLIHLQKIQLENITNCINEIIIDKNDLHNLLQEVIITNKVMNIKLNK